MKTVNVKKRALVHSPMKTRSQAAAAILDAETLRTEEQEATRETLEEVAQAIMWKLQELRQERDSERQELRELRRRDVERQTQFLS